jgi:hypothetical protein
MTRQYITWDYDAGIATEYERHGECNGCGQCCRAVITSGLAGLWGEESFEDKPYGRVGIGTDEHGKWCEVAEDGNRWFIRIQSIEKPENYHCEALGEDNRCAVHALKDRFADKFTLCDIWPMGPDHVTPFDQCSYSFEKIAEWPIEKDETA